jgi:amidase
VQPATRAALYGMKGTLNTINTTGAMGLSPIFDSIGAVGKSTRDMATLLGILQGGIDYSPHLKTSWEGLKVGFVDPELWWPAPFIVESREDYQNQVVSPSYFHCQLDILIFSLAHSSKDCS